jgi:hypothetical protein
MVLALYTTIRFSSDIFGSLMALGFSILGRFEIHDFFFHR